MYAFIAVHSVIERVFMHIYTDVGALYCKLCCIHWHRRLYYAILSDSGTQILKAAYTSAAA